MSAEPIRDVRLSFNYRLTLWERSVNRDNRDGRTFLRYRFCAPDGTVLFSGKDFGVPRYEAIDSDAAVRSLLGFLTLKPGDTDQDYFDSYTPEQLEWCEGDDAAMLSWHYEPGEGDGPIVDVDDADVASDPRA